jgi:hypothetical protein
MMIVIKRDRRFSANHFFGRWRLRFFFDFFNLKQCSSKVLQFKKKALHKERFNMLSLRRAPHIFWLVKASEKGILVCISQILLSIYCLDKVKTLR